MEKNYTVLFWKNRNTENPFLKIRTVQGFKEYQRYSLVATVQWHVHNIAHFQIAFKQCEVTPLLNLLSIRFIRVT